MARAKKNSKTATKRAAQAGKEKLGSIIEETGLSAQKKGKSYSVVSHEGNACLVYYDNISKNYIVLNSAGDEVLSTKFSGNLKSFLTGTESSKGSPVKKSAKSATAKKAAKPKQNKPKRKTKTELRIEKNKPVVDEPIVVDKMIARAKEDVVFSRLLDAESKEPIEGFQGIKNLKRKRVVSVVSDTYNLLPNKMVVDPVLDFFEKENVKYQLDEFSYVTDQRMRLHFTFPDLKIKDDTKQGILSGVFVHNSYNMMESFRMVAGGMRQVCGNGMVIGNIVKKLKVVHRAEQIREIATSNLDTLLTSYRKNIPIIEEKIKEMNATKATVKMLIDIGKTVDNKIFSQLMRTLGLAVEEDSNRDIVRSMKELDPKVVLSQSVWAVYNILTDYISHYVTQRYRVDYLRRMSKHFPL